MLYSQAGSDRSRRDDRSQPSSQGALWAQPIKPDEASALLVIDVQNCFLPGGSLAVKDGEQVVPVINRIAKGFANVVMTQDWHTAGHVSFASTHSGKKPFETVDLPYGKQVLWPDHCVQGTEGAALSKDLSIPQAELIIRKGFHKDVDSYSAFTEADGKTTTGLAGYLKARKIKRVFVAGPRDRLLRRLDRARCAQGGLRGLCGRRRLPRHRHSGLARQGLGRHGQGRRRSGSSLRISRLRRVSATTARPSFRDGRARRTSPNPDGERRLRASARRRCSLAAGAAFAPPLETPTSAGRSTRSPIV